MMISLVSYVMTLSIISAVKDLENYGLEQDTILTLNSIQSAIDVAAIAEYGYYRFNCSTLFIEFDFRKN